MKDSKDGELKMVQQRSNLTFSALKQELCFHVDAAVMSGFAVADILFGFD